MSNATVPATCTKDADCTSIAGYTKGCCMKYDPGSNNASILTALNFPSTAGKICALDFIKVSMDMMAT